MAGLVAVALLALSPVIVISQHSKLAPGLGVVASVIRGLASLGIIGLVLNVGLSNRRLCIGLVLVWLRVDVRGGNIGGTWKVSWDNWGRL